MTKWLGIGYLTTLTGLPEAECTDLLAAIDKRKPLHRLPPSVTGVLLFFAWMFTFGRGTDALEGATNWDLLAFLRRQGILGLVAAILLGYGIATTLGVTGGIVLRRRLVARQFRHHLFYPACFWCGYSLGGLQAEGATIRCPECGRESPIARQRRTSGP